MPEKHPLHWLIAIAFALPFVAITPAFAASAPVSEKQLAPWIAPEAGRDSPCARIYDGFVRHIEASGNAVVTVDATADDGFDAKPQTLRLELAPPPPGKKIPGKPPRVLVRSVFPHEAVGKLAGARIQLTADAPGEITLQFFEDAKDNGSLVLHKTRTQSTYALVAGKNTITCLFTDGGLDAAKARKINAIGFLVSEKQLPLAFSLDHISLVFREESDARTYSSDLRSRRIQKLETMVGWLRERGAPLGGNSGAGIERLRNEALLWDAAHLVSLKEQHDYWQSLAQHAKISANDPLFAALATLEKTRLAELRQLETGNTSLSSAARRTRVNALQAQTDAWIDTLQKRLTPVQRRWTQRDDSLTFLRPDGQPYRMFAPYFFRAIYLPGTGKDQRAWDMHYLAALGFNGIRLPVIWAKLEPVRGQFDATYLEMLFQIMNEAERHGLGISIDLHWPYPDWFLRGKPGQEPVVKQVGAEKHNAWHWTEALLDCWDRLGQTLRDVPNIVAFEVPGNEIPLGRGAKGITAYPTLVEKWNAWLKTHYNNDRATLAAAWSQSTAPNAASHALQPGENWDDNTILPPGFQGDANADAAYAENPRFWDFILWAADLQEQLTGDIVAALRKSRPDATGVSQYIMGGNHLDRSPVPTNFQSLTTYVGPHVFPGTHYGMGGNQARKAAALTLKSYDSEQQMENGEARVRRHVELGLGFCPFAFSARGGGGMLMSDDDWYLKPEVAHLPRMADWIRTSWPAAPAPGTKRVAVIENTRQAAAPGVLNTLGDIFSVLRENEVHADLFESLRVIRDPALISGYDAVITDVSYADDRLLDVLKRHNKAPVLLYGRLDRDAYARSAATGHGPAATLARLGILFAPAATANILHAEADSLDLSGQWDWALVPSPSANSKNAPKYPPSIARWEPRHVPGFWGEATLLGSLKYSIGDAWHRKTVVIPKAWEGRKLRLEMGAVDDFDWVWFNGRRIGHTGEERSNWWTASREYNIPSDLIRWGAANEILVCVRNMADDGGIWKAPVQISGMAQTLLEWNPLSAAAPATPVALAPLATFLGKSALRPDARIAAELRLPDGQRVPALVFHHNWAWWVGNTAWQQGAPADEAVLKTFLGIIP
ncbi:glycoside hydrolase family 2 [Opitutaceae bacterium TAV5]|nr:glycoside hydrolase family 2 [Opitutaceae bacterium TAV5]